MLACKKCHRRITEGLAQQSQSEIESALNAQNSNIASRRKAMNYGPLCDLCLPDWQAKYSEVIERKEEVADTRSPAIRRLDEACLLLARPE